MLGGGIGLQRYVFFIFIGWESKIVLRNLGSGGLPQWALRVTGKKALRRRW